MSFCTASRTWLEGHISATAYCVGKEDVTIAFLAPLEDAPRAQKRDIGSLCPAKGRND